MSNLVGTVHVGVELDSKGLPAQLRAALAGLKNDKTINAEMKKLGKSIGKSIESGIDGKKIGKKVARDINKAINKNIKVNVTPTVNVKPGTGQKAGKQVKQTIEKSLEGISFDVAVDRAALAAFKQLPQNVREAIERGEKDVQFTMPAKLDKELRKISAEWGQDFEAVQDKVARRVPAIWQKGLTSAKGGQIDLSETLRGELSNVAFRNAISKATDGIAKDVKLQVGRGLNDGVNSFKWRPSNAAKAEIARISKEFDITPKVVEAAFVRQFSASMKKIEAESKKTGGAIKRNLLDVLDDPMFAENISRAVEVIEKELTPAMRKAVGKGQKLDVIDNAKIRAELRQVEKDFGISFAEVERVVTHRLRQKYTVKVDVDVDEDRISRGIHKFQTVLLRSGSGGFFAGLTSSMAYAMKGVEAFGNMIGKVFKPITKLGDFLTDLGGRKGGKAGKGLEMLGKVTGTLGKGLTAAFSNPVTGVVGLVGVLAGLAKGITLLSPLVNGLVGFLTLLGGALANTVAAGAVLGPVMAAGAVGLGAMMIAAQDAIGSVKLLGKAMLESDPEKAAKAMDAYRESLKKLTPAARDTVEALEPIIKSFKDIKKAASEKFFEGMADSVTASKPIFDAFGSTITDVAGAMGDVVDRFLRLGEDTYFMESLNILLGNMDTIVRNIGTGLVDMTAGVVNFFSGISPVAERFSEAVKNVGARFKAWTEGDGVRDKITDWFNNAYEIAADVIGIIKTLGEVMISIFTATQGPLTENDGILQKIQDKLNEWLAWLKDPANGQKIQDWFTQAKDLAVEVWRVVEDIVEAFQEWNTESNREDLRNLIDTIGDLVTALMTLIDWGGKAFDALSWVINPTGSVKNLMLGKAGGVVKVEVEKREDIRDVGASKNFDPRRNTGMRPYAVGGLIRRPEVGLVGEAGPEAIIPLRRPLGQIDPSVRAMAALLRGNDSAKAKTQPGARAQRNIVVNQTITPTQSDPEAVAASVMNRFVAAAR